MVNYEEMQDLARRVSRAVSREWPGIEADDIEQEIMIAVLASPQSLEELGEGALWDAFSRVGTRYARAERYRYSFNSAQYVYTPTEVRALLAEAFYDPAAWEDAPRKEDYRLDVTAGGIVVSLWDLRDAFDVLKPHEQAAIEKRYNAAIPDGRGGYQAPPMTDAEQKRVSRAIETMSEYLNRKVSGAGASRANFNGPGSRKVISNAAAIAKTKDIDAA